jgi:N-acetylglucosaminyl-diphospho-decaprenol L-rhamnosyltransferase
MIMDTVPTDITSGKTVDVAFITISYNTRELLDNLVDFLAGTDFPFSCSITVVDNNSSDGSLESLGRWPMVQIVANGDNLGYGAAANRGVKATDSRYICVLNTDVILNFEAVTALWKQMEENEATGICTPVVTYKDKRIQVFFFKFQLLMYYWEFIAKLYTKFIKMLLPHLRRPLKIDGITGALLFLRRSYIGGDTLFDEDFFFYFEDTDLAFRWKKKGYASYILPDHSIIHLGGQSGKGRNNSLYYKGKYLFLKKHYGAGHAERIKLIDYWKITRKVISYRMLSIVFPTKQIKQKLASYRDYLVLLRSQG